MSQRNIGIVIALRLLRRRTARQSADHFHTVNDLSYASTSAAVVLAIVPHRCRSPLRVKVWRRIPRDGGGRPKVFSSLPSVRTFFGEPPKLPHCAQQYVGWCLAARLGCKLSRRAGFVGDTFFAPSTGPLAATHFDTFSKRPRCQA
jgi:hypothetical protein